jgi:hypothetical protein
MYIHSTQSYEVRYIYPMEVLLKQWFENLLARGSIYESTNVWSTTDYVVILNVCTLIMLFRIWARISVALGNNFTNPWEAAAPTLRKASLKH